MQLRFNFKVILIFYTIFLLTWSSEILGEGTKQILQTEGGHGKLQIYPGFSNFAYFNAGGTSAAPDYRLYIHIENIGEQIYYGFGDPLNHADAIKDDVKYRIKDPLGNIVVGNPLGVAIPLTGAGHINTLLEAQAGPVALASGGYSQLLYTPTMTGDYFIEFNFTSGATPNDRRKFKYFDVTVSNLSNEVKPGRLWSKAWQLTADDNGNAFNGTFFIYSDDGIVTSVNSNGMAPFVFTIACNQYGCYNTGNFINDRRSVSGDHILPQYKIFLNDPDSLVYPTGILGEVIPPIVVTPDCDGTAEIIINVTKPGNVDILLNLNPAPGVQPEDVSLSAVVVSGQPNIINWNGLNGLNQMVANNTNFDIIVTYINGLTNLPISDIDANPNGFIIDLKRPSGNVPPVFWDDHLVGGGMMTSIGCTYTLPTTGCHVVPISVGNNNTINTWWYAVTSIPYAVNYIHERIAQTLTFIQTTNPACANSTNNVYKVDIEPNTTFYHWKYMGTGATIIQTNPWDNLIKIDFAANATSGFLEVYGTNNNCNTPGDTTQVYITVIPVPDLTTTLVQSACSDVAFSIPLTSSPPATIYNWNVTGTDCSGNIQTCPAGNGASTSAITGNLAVTDFNPGTVIYHVTPVSGGCNGTTKPLTVTVSPKPNVINPATPAENLCDGKTTNINLESGMTGPSLTWLWNVQPSGCSNIQNCPAQGTSTPISETLKLALDNAPGFVNFTITPTFGGCAGDPYAYTVNVLPLPDVALEDFAPVCLNTPPFAVTGGSPVNGVYMLSGNPITIFDPGLMGVGSHLITYIFTDGNGCTDSVQKPITVQDLITPSLSGKSTVCVGVAEKFTTDPGMDLTSYTWSVSPDGNITPGANPWEISVTWSNATPSLKTVNVSYTDPNGCQTIPATKQVTVNTLPIISISGNFNACFQKSYSYSTETGKANYSWNASPGNTITYTNDTAHVTWNMISGNEWIEVNYINANGCTAANPYRKTVVVNPSPVYEVTGPVSVCAGSTGILYQLQGNETGNWALTAGGSITSISTNVNSVFINWFSSNSAVQSSLTVNYENSLGCLGNSTKTINIQPLPITTFTTTTPSPVCQDFPTPSVYTVDPGGPAASYSWQVTPPELAAIVNPTANPVSITWKLSINSGPQMASLILTATTTATTPACVAASSPVAIIINPKPSTHLTTCFDLKTTTSGKPFLLRGGTPIGAEGRYYIDQTTNPPVSMFNPATAGAGIHTIHYGYTNINGCVAYDSKQINVIQAAGFSCGGVVTDPRDGNHYNTVQIGSQCWMQENLNYGVSIGTPGLTQTDNCVTEKFCLPADINCGTYGALYQWDELMAYGFISQNQGICMPGWHVPSESEWQTMINIISSGITPPADGIAGGFIKDTTRNPGFYALTRGIYFMNNRWAFSNEKPKGTMFWTSTTYGAGHGVSRGVNVPNPSVSRYSGSRGNAFSVRCVKD